MRLKRHRRIRSLNETCDVRMRLLAVFLLFNHTHVQGSNTVIRCSLPFTLKRAKIQPSRFYQYRSKTMILFATQYKNDNTAFHRGAF